MPHLRLPNDDPDWAVEVGVAEFLHPRTQRGTEEGVAHPGGITGCDDLTDLRRSKQKRGGPGEREERRARRERKGGGERRDRRRKEEDSREKGRGSSHVFWQCHMSYLCPEARGVWASFKQFVRLIQHQPLNPEAMEDEPSSSGEHTDECVRV